MTLLKSANLSELWFLYLYSGHNNTIFTGLSSGLNDIAFIMHPGPCLGHSKHPENGNSVGKESLTQGPWVGPTNGLLKSHVEVYAFVLFLFSGMNIS